MHLRLRLPSDGAGPDCVPLVAGVSPLPNGDAWVAGSCGLRGRLTPSGFVDLAAATRRIREKTGALKFDCDGSAFYTAVAARSANDVFLGGQTRCGLDPNGIWPRPVERFDGQQFHELRAGATVDDPRQRAPSLFAIDPRSAYFLALGDDSGGSPECAVYELEPTRTTLLRACLTPKLDRPSSSERFLSIGLDRDGTLWVSGQRFSSNAAHGGGIPFMLHWAGGHWLEGGPPDSGILTRAADGKLWLFGKQPWALASDGWRTRSVPIPVGAADYAVGDENDVWFATESGVQHFDGRFLKRVPFDSPPTSSSISQIELSAGHLWANSAFFVWELRRPGEAAAPLWEKR